MSAVPVLVLKCSHGKVNMYLFACLRERCAGFCFAAERVSDNFRTQTTRMKAWAKLERHVIEGGALVFAELPRTRWIIPTAVAAIVAAVITCSYSRLKDRRVSRRLDDDEWMFSSANAAANAAAAVAANAAPMGSHAT